MRRGWEKGQKVEKLRDSAGLKGQQGVPCRCLRLDLKAFASLKSGIYAR